MNAYGWAVLVAVGVVACGGATDPAAHGGGTTSTSVGTGGSGGLPACGDGVCQSDEDFTTCPEDGCRCGDFTCDVDEAWWNCPEDCGICGDGNCSLGEDPTNCAGDCYCGNGTCETDESRTSCPVDCDLCGNGVCNLGEDFTNCPQDGCTCGNGTCDEGETFNNCYQDGCTCGNDWCDPGESTSCSWDCVCGEPPSTVPCGDFVCDTSAEFCVKHVICSEVYSCEPITSGCEGESPCACGLPYGCWRGCSISECWVIECMDQCGS